MNGLGEFIGSLIAAVIGGALFLGALYVVAFVIAAGLSAGWA